MPSCFAAARLALLCFAAASAAPARADDADMAADAADAQERIVVTGEREPLFAVPDVNAGALGAVSRLDLPFSLSGFDEALIKTQRATTLSELLRNDPSVQNFNFGGNYDFIAIRGFETATTSSFRRDGLQAVTLTDVPFENKSRIEVLKGVSGFLFGFAEPGGTINYVVKRPTARPFVALDVEARTDGGQFGHLDASAPLGDRAGVRVNLAGERQGDFTQARDLRRLLGAVAVDWRPSESLTLRFDFEHQWKALAASAQIPLASDGSLLTGFDKRVLLGAPWLRYETWGTYAAARADLELGSAWTLTAQSTLADLEREAAFPYVTELTPAGDATVVPSLGPKAGQNSRGWSHQALLTGAVATGPIEHRPTFGVYHASRSGVFCAYAPDGDAFVTNVFRPAPPPPRQSFEPVAPGQGCPQRSDQTHLFASDTATYGPVSVVGGVRYIDYSSRSRGRFISDYADTAVTPTAALIVAPAERVRVYASWAQSLQEGGVAPDDPEVVNAGEQLPPLKSNQIEAGVKAEVAGLTLTAAAFRIRRPAEYVDPGTQRFGRFGLQRHRGIELLAQGALSRELAMVAGLTWLDPRRLRNLDPALDGTRPPNVAKVQASGFIDYAPGWASGAGVTAGLYHVGSRAFDEANSRFVDGYTRLDLGVRYAFRLGGSDLVARLTLDNATNKFFYESIAYGGGTVGAPRTVTASLQAAF